MKTGIDTRKVLHQQQQLINSIRAQTDANLRIAADLKKLSAMGELFDQIELQLKESVLCINSSTSSSVSNAVSALSRVAEKYSGNKNDMPSNDLIALKNHLTGLLDISMKSSKQHIEDFVEALTVDLTDELKKICTEVQSLSSLMAGTLIISTVQKDRTRNGQGMIPVPKLLELYAADK